MKFESLGCCGFVARQLDHDCATRPVLRATRGYCGENGRRTAVGIDGRIGEENVRSRVVEGFAAQAVKSEGEEWTGGQTETNK